MNLLLAFHHEVPGELRSAHDWYEQSRSGHGDDFAAAVDRVFEAISANPEVYGIAHLDIREGLLARFPYVVYYRVLRNRIRVVAVCHTSRDPSVWQTRL